MTGHIIAEHDDDIGTKRVGTFDDGLDMLARHPGIAGVQIGNGRELQLEARGPLWRPDVVARHVEPQQRLETDTIGRRRGTEGAETGEEAKELTACDHAGRKW